MKRLRNILYLIFCIPVFIILVWFFAVPDELIKGKIEDAISNAGQGQIRASLNGFKKGLFITVYSDSLDLDIDSIHALRITDLSGFLDPGYLARRRIVFSIKGKMGGGGVNGLLKYPAQGELDIEKAELDLIPYLTQFGIRTNGFISAKIILKDNKARLSFRITDMGIRESAVIIPFINSFHKAHGALSVTGNEIILDSVSLEGDKGYARLKGGIRNNMMDLRLELMPYMEKLNSMESMLIGKYIVSPGYYIIPVKGPKEIRDSISK